MKLILFASRRLSRLAKMLGKQNMDLIQQAYEECGVGQDAGVWKEFVTAMFPRQAFHDESRKQS